MLFVKPVDNIATIAKSKLVLRVRQHVSVDIVAHNSKPYEYDSQMKVTDRANLSLD